MLIENYQYLLALLGAAFLGVAILPAYLNNSFLTLPIIYILLGYVLSIFWKELPHFDPIKHNLLVEKITEITVILSLMGAGIKLNQPLKWKVWRPTFRLLFVTMPLFIVAIAVMSNIWIGISYGAAVLLGAVLSPTDPVLAGDIQVSAPNSEEKDNKVRFTLTSEAGLNDGLAFPFVFFAGYMVTKGFNAEMIGSWFSYEFLYKIVVGIIMGFLCGKGIGYLLFNSKHEYEFQDGFVAVAITLLTYGATEIVHGYGFIAVFVAAYFFRQTEIDHHYHKELHDFTEQIEKLLVCVLLIIFGIAIGHGLIDFLAWNAAIIGLVVVLVLRPLLSYIGLYKSGLNSREKWIVSFLGIKGIGSFYYLAYGLHHFNFDTIDVKMIWSVVGFVILISVVLHGISAPIIMSKHERLENLLKFKGFKS